jgi:hypothetical protein
MLSDEAVYIRLTSTADIDPARSDSEHVRPELNKRHDLLTPPPMGFSAN